MGMIAELEYAGVFTYKAEFANGLTEHEIDHVYIAVGNDKDPKPNPEEAKAYKWISIPGLQKQLKEQPEMFTPWLHQALDVALKVYVFS